MNTIKCPFCECEFTADKNYVYCETCGNDFDVRDLEQSE